MEDKLHEDICKALNKKIDKLQKEVDRLWIYEEMAKRLTEEKKHFIEQLDIKRNVTRVIVSKDGDNYALQLTKVIDAPDGLYIEGRI